MQQQLHKWLLVTLSLILLCSACLPSQRAYPNDANILTFSADIWGGTPFNEAQKKNLFVKALSSKTKERIEQDIPYTLEGNAEVSWFLAFYEVDARKLPPSLNNGFELVVANGTASELKLTNSINGVSWLVKLSEVKADILAIQ